MTKKHESQKKELAEPLELSNLGSSLSVPALLVFAAAALATQILGNTFYFSPNNVSTFWPSSGLVVASLLLTKLRYWPAIMATLFSVQIASEMIIYERPFDYTMAFLLPISTETLLGAGALRLSLKTSLHIWDTKHFFYFLFVAVLASTLVAALVGAMVVEAFFPVSSFWQVWQVWWFADALGVLIVAPPLLAWFEYQKDRPNRYRFISERRIEIAVWAAALLVVSIVAFGTEAGERIAIIEFPYVVIPFFVWAAVRFDIRVIATGLLASSCIIVSNTVMSLGPFVATGLTPQEIVLAMQAFLAVIVATVMILSNQVELVRQRTDERKQAEEALRQAQKMETVGQLTGGVAHDFNNLLAVMQGNAELLAEKVGSNNSMIQAILRASARGAELTQRLLAFSRRQSLRPQSIDLGELTAGMSELLKRTLGETIEIETNGSSNLWPALADPGQVENALLNLAINARDAMPGGGNLTIECMNARLDQTYVARNPEARTGDYVVLAVSDTGVGMTAEVQEHVFEPFYTTKEVGKGSGLGLSMVYGFTKQSGGHVAIDSKEGHGTTVKLYFPRSEKALELREQALKEPLPLGRNELVLVVEDDPDVRALTVIMLESLGYHVVDAADAESARAVLEKEKVALVLSDVVLPGGTSGSDFGEAARQRDPGLKVLYMSGYTAEVAKRDDTLKSGQNLLNKPFRRQELAIALREALDH